MANQERLVTFSGAITPGMTVFGTDDITKEKDQWVEPSTGIPEGNRIRRIILTGGKGSAATTAPADIAVPNNLKLILMRDGKPVNTIDAVWLQGKLVGPVWPPLPLNVGMGRIQWGVQNRLPAESSGANNYNNVTALFDWVNPLQQVVLS